MSDDRKRQGLQRNGLSFNGYTAELTWRSTFWGGLQPHFNSALSCRGVNRWIFTGNKTIELFVTECIDSQGNFTFEFNVVQYNFRDMDLRDKSIWVINGQYVFV